MVGSARPEAVLDSTFFIATVARILFILVVVIGAFSPLTAWADRRLAAMLQDRIGPVRAAIAIGGARIRLLGLLHPLADAVKFLWKEDFVPPRADKLLFALAPIIALVPVLACFAVIPFGGTLYLDHLREVLPSHPTGPAFSLQIAPLDIGIMFVLALGGTGVVGAALAGYSSDNKYALLGGLRAASQMVSYEVAFGLSLVGCFMLYGSLALEEMVRWQVEHGWGIAYQPLAFMLFLTAAIAESKRIPFDTPEGESELAAGYFTEYSGMKFVMFYMAEYIQTILASFLITAIFLGGHDLPFVFSDGLRVQLFGHTLIEATWRLSHVVVIALGVVGFLLKAVALCWLQLIIRWSLPRFRYDQVMRLCWRYMLPLCLFNVLATGVVLLLTR